MFVLWGRMGRRGLPVLGSGRIGVDVRVVDMGVPGGVS